MSADEAMRARVQGKQDMEAKTAWSLNVLGFRLRCLAVGHTFEVQVRGDLGWKDVIAKGFDAHVLLQRCAGLKNVKKALDEYRERQAI